MKWLKYVLTFFSIFALTCLNLDKSLEIQRKSPPSFQRGGSFSDTAFAMSVKKDTLRVSNHDVVTYSFLKDSIPFVKLKDSIVTICPNLKDTGSYEIKLIASDSIEQHDTCILLLWVFPKIDTLTVLSNRYSFQEGGDIHCGQTTISGPSYSYEIQMEYNSFGLLSKTKRISTDTQSMSYSFEYDSLLFPIKIYYSDTMRSIYDSIRYDSFHNMIQTMTIGVSSQPENIVTYSYDSKNRLSTMEYSYETQICDEFGKCSTWTRNDLVQFDYNNYDSLIKETRTFNGGQFADSIVYLYNSQNQLTEQFEYYDQWKYPTRYTYNIGGQLIEKTSYSHYEDIGDVWKYAYNTNGYVSKIDNYCGNYGSLTNKGYSTFTWTRISIIHSDATNKFTKYEQYLSKKAFQQNGHCYSKSILKYLKIAKQKGLVIWFESNLKRD